MSIIELIYTVFITLVGVYGVIVFSKAIRNKNRVLKTTGSETESDKAYFNTIDKYFNI